MESLFIRADMNKEIATGHVMRCLSVADAAAKKGIKVVFIGADHEGEQLVGSRGYEYISLETNYRDMESELPALLDLIEKMQITHLLVDSYQVTRLYLATLSKATRVIYMDDVNAFDYPVCAVINYANYADSFDYTAGRKGVLGADETQFFLGCYYVPLRAMFQNKPPKEIKPSVENVLLMSGGSDPTDMLRGILEVIPKGHYKKITVLCGRFYAHREELIRDYCGYPEVEILPNVDNMDDYLADADLAISAGGSVLYELAAMGTPAITFSFIDNQMENVKRFDTDELMDLAGDARTLKEDGKSIVPGKVAKLLLLNEDYQRRLSRSRKLQALVDGNGATHIVEALESLNTDKQS